jgi:hypothetical protein
MQTKQELEDWYDVPDRWNYFQSNDDKIRKDKIMGMLPCTYDNALDVGCGECFIAKDLPAKNIFGIELSDMASSRFPENVTRIYKPSPEIKYDLVISTGTMYSQYDHNLMYSFIMEAASKHILIAGIKDWIIEKDYGKLLNRIEFPYMHFTQIVSLYEINQ